MNWRCLFNIHKPAHAINYVKRGLVMTCRCERCGAQLQKPILVPKRYRRSW